MLVTFIGPPISGKTTVAATSFATLKEQGLACEFVSEFARTYIAQKKRVEGGFFTGLDDLDQLHIMQGQVRNEETMNYDPDYIVIADSSAVLALLYMTEDFIRLNPSVLKAARQAAASYDVVFRCKPVRPSVLNDPNRIHSHEQSLALEQRIDRVLELAEVDSEKVLELSGPNALRARSAVAWLTREWTNRQVAKAGLQ